MSTLGIVIVNYNSWEELEGCLASLYRETTAELFHVVVVDNASTHQDISCLQNRFPEAQFILNSTNYGFSIGCNQGIRYRKAPFYLLLNPDCIVQNRAIEETLEFMKGFPEAGIAGCRVNHPDGSLQLACRRRIPRPSSAFYRFSGLSRLFPNSRRFGAYNMSYVEDDQIHEVEAVSGSFLMFRHEVLESSGYLDEQFFLYGEDLDFCYRATQAGWKVMYYPKAQVVHLKGSSSSSLSHPSRFHFYNAMEIFYKKHFFAQASRIERSIVLLGIRLLYLANRLLDLLTGNRAVGSKY